MRILLGPEAIPVAVTPITLFRWYGRSWIQHTHYYAFGDHPALLVYDLQGELVVAHGASGSTFVRRQSETQSTLLGQFTGHAPYGLRLDDRDHPVVLTRRGGDVFAYRLNAL